MADSIISIQMSCFLGFVEVLHYHGALRVSFFRN